MSEDSGPDRDADQSSGREDQENREQDDEVPGLVPESDAGPTAAEKFSVDEKDHGRQDHGP